jgi:hypothetical protein
LTRLEGRDDQKELAAKRKERARTRKQRGTRPGDTTARKGRPGRKERATGGGRRRAEFCMALCLYVSDSTNDYNCISIDL